MKLKKIFGCFLFILFSVCFAKSEIVWIVNPSTSGVSVSSSDLKRILLGKTVVWDSGQKVSIATVFSLNGSKKTLKSSTGKTPKQFLNHWKKLAFVGKGVLPKSFDTQEEVIAYVASTPGAIGYVEDTQVGSSVNILKLK